MSTPMMKQYEEQKERYKDTLLFFRMGDFYEMFNDDAVTASKALDIALTKRAETPMCGVPVHSYESYLQKLIRAGYKVAICDQLETPEEAKKRGYKEIVRREVVRVVTPGTLTEETLLEAGKANYLLCFSRVGAEFGLAWVDISTGQFSTCSTSANLLAAELARLSPSEILLPDNLLYDENFFETYAEWKNKLTPQAANIFEFARAENKLKSFYKVISLEGFGVLSRVEISACGALLEYLSLTQKESLPVLEFPRQIAAGNFMQIDSATRKSLELGQVFEVINFTKTSAGARLLYSYLSSPLVDATTINSRLDAVEFFINNQIPQNLKQFPDLERATARICIGRASPRDMLALKNALTLSGELKDSLKNKNLPALLAENVANIKTISTLLSTLIDAFRDDAGFNLKDGNFIRAGFNSQLDNLINIRDHSRQLINNLREKYAAESGISNLKIIHNNMLGFFVEVTAQNAKKLSEEFIHRQTMANAMRFTTPELSELQTKIISARDEALAIEMEIFAQISEMVRSFSADLYSTARGVAFIDTASALAELASTNKFSRPLVDNSREFKITQGRHPVVETVTEFVPNNTNLGIANNIWLLTGPNMAGKSTFLRQNALIAVLAQIGSFVPAESSHIGVIDKIFSRVGASDDLARGRSTFMVEMVETAAILNLSTSKSLVILDEIGRGTATYDGLSIAWAVLEYLHDKINCRAIFATHYHELTSIGLARIANHSMKVEEWKEDIIFLHEVVSGAADKSYGIHVAKLAGVPKQVTARAEKILKKLEDGQTTSLPLFNVEIPEATSAKPDLLAGIDPNSLSPKEALDLLFKLKEM